MAPPNKLAFGPIAVFGFAPIISSGTGIVIVPAPGSNVAWTRPISSQGPPTVHPPTRRKKGASPGSRGGGQMRGLYVGLHVPRRYSVKPPLI